MKFSARCCQNRSAKAGRPRHHNQPWGGFDSGGQPELQSRASGGVVGIAENEARGGRQLVCSTRDTGTGGFEAPILSVFIDGRSTVLWRSNRDL